MRPVEKICQVADGPIDQKRLFQSPSEANLLPWVPTSPVSEMWGNRSAVATPISAVAAWIWASAWRISGRRRSNSDGTPTGTAGGAAGTAAGRRQFCQQGPGLATQQDAETVDGLLGGLLEHRDLGGRSRDLGVGVGDIQGH